MCKCDLYDKRESENEHQNKHFAMYFATIVLKYFFRFSKYLIEEQINIAIRFFYDPHFEA
jgi:hypothetical protein